MRGGFGKKKNSIVKMLVAGFVIMLICLAACFYLVSTLKNSYTNEFKEDYNFNHDATAALVDAIVTDVELQTDALAKSISERSGISKQDIKKALEYYECIALPYSSYFLTEDGYLIDSEDMKKINGEDPVYGALYNEFALEKRSMIKFGQYDDKATSGSQLLISSPALKGTDYYGSVIAIVQLDDLLHNESFETQHNISDCFILDKNMIVEGRNVTNYLTDKEQNDFSVGILPYTNGSDNGRKTIQTMKGDIFRNEKGYVSVMSEQNKEILICYTPLESIKGAEFVSCYTENLVNDRIQPLIFRCAIICIVMMVVMIGVIVYVWASAKKANITIEKLAYEDSVTKGKNINYFKDFSTEVMSVFKETPFVIYRFDISNFRYINEAYGHLRADEVLASCIKNFEEVFSEKELCVRMNADQFLAIVVNDKGMAQRVKQYESKVNEDARSRGIKFPIKFKTGVYQVKKHDRDIDVMIDHANVARKTLGDGKQMTAFYSDNIVTNMRKIDRIESDMQRALATGEFKVYYQPKWDIVADHVAGAEALVRWIRADGSMVFPDEFIPVFEKNGFVEKLDFYMLETVCAQMRELLDNGKTVYPVSVNQSRLLLHSPDYVDNVEKIIKKYNIPEHAIELEITETVFQDEREEMIDTMERLKKCGVRLSMDDFGSGYSSLNMLKDAPFDIIKIDREFFSESVTSEISMWILQKIVEMVNGLGMELICEGVENGEQSALLRSIGCRMVQGYFYSKPIPAEEYIDRYC